MVEDHDASTATGVDYNQPQTRTTYRLVWRLSISLVLFIESRKQTISEGSAANRYRTRTVAESADQTTKNIYRLWVLLYCLKSMHWDPVYMGYLLGPLKIATAGANSIVYCVHWSMPRLAWPATPIALVLCSIFHVHIGWLSHFQSGPNWMHAASTYSAISSAGNPSQARPG